MLGREERRGTSRGRSWGRVQAVEGGVGARRIAVEAVDDGVAPYPVW